MVTEELRTYIHKALMLGKSPDVIRRDLIGAGWHTSDIETVLAQFITQQSPEAPSRSGGVISVLLLVILLLGGSLWYLWKDRFDLRETNAQEVQEFYARLSESQVGFTDTGDMVFPDEQKFRKKRAELITNKQSFVEADLRTMKMKLYTDGEVTTTVDILTKGKDRSWWETPTGNYTVLSKNLNGYSTIGNVWMPYSIQFYGNYLIHGWPHYDDGTPVPQGYSGGCIRLATEDAKKVFEFAGVGTPILVLEDESTFTIGALNQSQSAQANLPLVDARSFLIFNLVTGETIIEKNADSPLPIASLTKLMTAITAHEVIYLGREIPVQKHMLANIAQTFYPEIGHRYIGLDLLYPLLMQSSNDSANVLAGYIGQPTFVKNMNLKATSLEMDDTTFADPSGISAQNISTAYDLAKLLQYIYFKRPFVFDITKGIAFENVGLIKLGDTVNITNLKNYNEFVEDPSLIGVKNGQTTAAKQTLATVWNIKTKTGNVPVAIVVLGSEDRRQATMQLHNWLLQNFQVE